MSTARLDRPASFTARHELTVKVAAGTRQVRAWFALPLESESAQAVSNLAIECAQPHRIVTDDHGNRQLYVEADNPQPGELKALVTFDIARSTVTTDWMTAENRPISSHESRLLERQLAANTHVIIDERIRSLSKQIVGNEKRVIPAARLIYDWVLANIDYWVKDPANKKASPVGSTEYCLTAGTGNCTDFHSLWTSLARAAGIPTRMVYGSFFKLELDGVDADQSYHCWPEFWAPGTGWAPHDVAVADLFVDEYPVNDANAKLVRLTTADGYKGPDANLVNWYFGNLDNRRVTWSVGRDLVLDPKPLNGPINAMAKAHVEIDGKVAAEMELWTRKLTFKGKS